MEEHLKKRPQKRVFQKEVIDFLRNQAIKKIKSKLLPDEKIIKIILIGSSIKTDFGKYRSPGFRGSYFLILILLFLLKMIIKFHNGLTKSPMQNLFQMTV